MISVKTPKDGPIRYRLLSALTLVVLALIWWFVTAFELVEPLFVPSPAAVVASFARLVVHGYRGVTLLEHLAHSRYRVMVGFLLAVITAVPLGLIMGRNKTVRAIVDPLIELYRRAHGRWPTTLEEVFGDDPARLPLDPFSGDAPMRYIVDETGCTIYSIGEDETDDGGAITAVDGKRPTDIGFRLLSPHLRGATVTTQPVEQEVWDAIEALRAATTQPAATAPVR